MFVIGDAHIKSNKEYIDFIHVVNTLAALDKVVLLGDILDFTKIEVTKLDWKVKDFVHPNLVYVYGNHDIVAPELGIPCYEFYEEGGLRFEHGHRFEARLNSNFFIQPEEYNNLFRTLCWSKANANKLTHTLWQLKTLITRKVHSNIKYDIINEMYRYGNMICAHTHAELFNKATNTLLVDSYVDKKLIYYVEPEKFKRRGTYDTLSHTGTLKQLRDSAYQLRHNKS
ncbi:putative phosphodiesterase [Methanococcus maripaludis]|uniref:Putative phosphodiesterase n=1 Tax=Methanococcus maripaludis TaxID=39152 RepID=A0A7J9NWR4_METMI|nr:metallophosphoesterase [Methanococcus maripaludis]MBA2851757.1 putative phosphodiesterase [Methanococcus maripaludis]